MTRRPIARGLECLPSGSSVWIGNSSSRIPFYSVTSSISLMEDGDPEAYLKAAKGYVEAMFEGKRAGIRPIFEKILEMARRLGSDVKVCPCKTIVPVYRQHVSPRSSRRPRAVSTRLRLG